MYWNDGMGWIELQITKAEAHHGSHQGQCDEDVMALSRKPRIALQLAKLDPATVAKVLKEYGAWDTEELADHEANLQRLLWIACGDICEGNN